MERIALITLLFIGGFVINANAQCVKGNCFNGSGTWKFANGDKYEGQWVDSKMHGFGKYEFANGDRYNGDFHDNKRDGSGTYVWKDKGIYKGQWKADKREGSGTFKWTNSATYIGFWRDDQIIDMDVNTVTDTQERPTFGN
tara:strand:+ start:7068 stop:7490 length:423 start_codon:yes stop_codon:yes gene_type:complete